jgi:septation ring formation regulator EzrA
MIKKYNDFVKEKYNVTQNDSTEVASDKSYFNKSESDIKEFLTKKTTIDNIYKTYTDEKDLIKKLAAQKFIPVNTSDKKKIKFTNPLIGLYALSAEKSRELRSLESELGTQTDTLSQRQSAIGTNPDATDSLQNDVAYTQGKISDINSRIAKLKNEIVTLERNTRDKLKQMKDGLANNKKKLDYFIKTK